MENVVSTALKYEGADYEFTVALAPEVTLTGVIVHIRENIYRLTGAHFEYYFDATKVLHIHKRN